MVLNNRFFYYWQSIDCQILVFNCSHIVYRIICDFFGGKKTTIQNELRFDGKFNDFWEFSIRLGNLLLWICVLSSNLIINLDSTDFDSDTFIRTYIKFKKKIQRNFWKSLLHDRWFIAIFLKDVLIMTKSDQENHRLQIIQTNKNSIKVHWTINGEKMAKPFNRFRVVFRVYFWFFPIPRQCRHEKLFWKDFQFKFIHSNILNRRTQITSVLFFA